ncbi:hypothetical protein M413DRAFT_124656 [Hebeloma cylindrosporum]|uniref:Uncharacterized protein n=1 Tax=Hebeloma cylindrosporum TaxID=76867 RepID=A0A0C3CF70_HEBCY|nr:hypothetical protein M413DRAFT_124656 [Hebeloma cylindrosporum h7]
MDRVPRPFKSCMVQMHPLIVDSSRKKSESLEQAPTVTVDGLDECEGGPEKQGTGLEIIYEAVAIQKLPLSTLSGSSSQAVQRHILS